MNALKYFLPGLILSGFSFALLGLHAFQSPGSSNRRTSLWLALGGIIAACVLMPMPSASAPALFGRDMLIWDGLSFFITWIGLFSALFVALLSETSRDLEKEPLSVYYALLLMIACGLYLVATANDFLMIFLAIELVGIPSFVLTGFIKSRTTSSEGAIKFFLIGAFSSAMLAYGMSILYGLTGSTSLLVLQSNLPKLHEHLALTGVAIFFIIASFGFKIALVPFHMWVPDAFEGAPVPFAAFLSVAPKIAGIGLALRVFSLLKPEHAFGAFEVFAVLSALTMTIGNVIGLQQRNVIRLLAYSSIAHMGYMLLGLVAQGPDGTSSIYLYGWVYLFMNMGVFALVIAIANATGSADLSSFSGLAKRSPFLSAILVLFMISLAGLPPTAGFLAKFYVFSAALKSGWTWLVIVAAVNSVISVGYYFKVLHAMYFQTSEKNEPIPLSIPLRTIIAVTSFATLFLGLFPQTYLVKLQSLAAAPQQEATTERP